MIKRVEGQNPNVRWFPRDDSQDFTNGQFVKFDSGEITPAGSGDKTLVGIVLRDIASDNLPEGYAFDDNKPLPVDIPTTETVLEADVKTGTLSDSDVGGQFDLHADGDGIDVDSTGDQVVTVVGRISDSKALIKLNASVFTEDAA